VSESLVFSPPRRRGLLFHTAAVLVLGGASAAAFLIGMNQQAGAAFVGLLLASLLLFAPLPWVAYRAYALMRAAYRIERDGLRLRWGLRAEDIPLPEVEWVRRVEDLAGDIPRPPLTWPGALLGVVQARDLGPVEYMAAGARPLLLIATPKRVYAISPEDPDAFIRGFQHTLEMGSLSPIASVSVLPAAYLGQVWSDVLARWLLAAGLTLAVLLFAGVSLAIPTRAQASLGFYPDGAPLPPGPAAQLMLLPILGAFAFAVDLSVGLFFYRRIQTRKIAYFLWGSAVVTTLLLLTAVMWILVYSP
jgi:hypothetical protein